jgi:hypothetical protein
MERRTGFEPATTRGTDEVTAIFTTDRGDSWRGTGDAVAALAGKPPFGVRDSNPLGAIAPLPRSNRHLHHRLADACAPAIEKARWGTGEIGVSDVNSRSPFRKSQSRGACCLCEAASPVRASKAGFEPALSMVRSIRNLHHQRWLSRWTRQTKLRINSIAALRTTRRCSEPFKVRPAIGVRLSPRSLRQAPRL